MGQALFMVRTAAAAAPVVPVDLGNSADFNRKTTAAVAALAAGSVFPAGFVALTAAAAPYGWLVCDGSAVARRDFPALFAAIGTTYGAGDGATTFNLPTQAQCVPPPVAPSVPQVISGGSVEPTDTVVPTNPGQPGSGTGGGGGGNTTTGGRPPSLDNRLVNLA